MWEKGAGQRSYRIGFLQAEPDSLPPTHPARVDATRYDATLAGLATGGNRLATLLRRVLSAPGQNFLVTCEQALQKLADQDTVVALLNSLSGYCRDLRSGDGPCQDVATILTEAEVAVTEQGEAQALLATVPELWPEARALYALARMDEAIVTPIFARSSASGSLMRRKIEPVLQPVLEQIAVLRRPAHG